MSLAEAVVRITAPHFVAGLVFQRQRVIEAAPILRYMIGWASGQMIRYCKGKRWTWERVT